MNESYMEYMVQKNRSPLFKWGAYLCVFLSVVSLLIGIMGIPIALLFFGIFAVATYFLKTRSIIEFEYLYLEKEISIDKIIGMRKRKKMARIKMENVDLFAPINGDKAKEAIAHARGKDVDFSTGNKETKDKCYIIVTGDGTKYMLEPNTKFVKMAQMAAPRKVIVQ